MKGYWKQPELSRETLRGGWLHTGDIGWLDADGFLTVVDRKKDMIISGGENVFSTEVEDVIHQHPAVQECAVIGVPHEKWVEAVHAIVVLKTGQALEADDIIGHCQSFIAGYKCPRSVDIRTEPLPKSGATKIAKAELREAYLKRGGSQISASECPSRKDGH